MNTDNHTESFYGLILIFWHFNKSVSFLSRLILYCVHLLLQQSICWSWIWQSYLFKTQERLFKFVSQESILLYHIEYIVNETYLKYIEHILLFSLALIHL